MNLLQNFFTKVGVGQQQKQDVQSWWVRFFGSNPPDQKPTPSPQTKVEDYYPDLTQWSNFKYYARNQAAKRGYNPGVVVGQLANESERGVSPMARTKLNYGGIGAYDSDPDKALEFKSVPDFFDYYFNLIEKRYPKAYAVRDKPRKYLEELRRGGYFTDDLSRYINNTINTPEYREFKDYVY